MKNPLKYLDTATLKQYTKIAKAWEDKGHSIYTLSTAVGMPSYTILGGCLGAAGQHLLGNGFYGIIPHIGLYSWDTVYNLNGLSGKIKNESVSDEMAMDDSELLNKKINRTVRLPTFLIGASFIGYSAYNVCRFFASNEPLDPNIYGYSIIGMGLLGMASSQYLKDRNPKLLEKQPSKLKAKIKEFAIMMKNLIPSPIPAPQMNLKHMQDGLLSHLYDT